MEMHVSAEEYWMGGSGRERGPWGDAGSKLEGPGGWPDQSKASEAVPAVMNGKSPATKGNVSRADKGSAACTKQTKAVCMPQHDCYQGRGEGFPIVCCKRRQPLHPFIPGVFVLRLRHASEVSSCSDRVTSNAANTREGKAVRSTCRLNPDSILIQQ